MAILEFAANLPRAAWLRHLTRNNNFVKAGLVPANHVFLL